MGVKGCAEVRRGTQEYAGVRRGTQGYARLCRLTQGCAGVRRGTQGVCRLVRIAWIRRGNRGQAEEQDINRHGNMASKDGSGDGMVVLRSWSLE